MVRTAMNVIATAEDRASGPLGRVKEALDENGVALAGLGGAVTALQGAWTAITGVFGGATSVLAGWTKEAMEAEKAERDLTAVLTLHRDKVEDVLPRLKEQAETIQHATGIDGDSVLALQAKLRTLGVEPKYLEAATMATLGWARATGKDMADAAKDVIKTLNGKATALDKLGVKVRTVDEALHAMADGGLAQLRADSETLEAAIHRLEQGWGDFHEAIGGLVTQSPNATNAVNAVGMAVRRLQEILATPEAGAAVDGFFGAITRKGADAIEAVASVLEASDKLVLFWKTWGKPLEAAVMLPFDAPMRFFGKLKEMMSDVTESLPEKVDAQIGAFDKLAGYLNAQGINMPLLDKVRDFANEWKDPTRFTKTAPAELRAFAAALREAGSGGAVKLPDLPELPAAVKPGTKVESEIADEKKLEAERAKAHAAEVRRQTELMRLANEVADKKRALKEHQDEQRLEIEKFLEAGKKAQIERMKVLDAEAKATRDRITGSIMAAYESWKGFFTQGFKSAGDFFDKLGLRIADFMASKALEGLAGALVNLIPVPGGKGQGFDPFGAVFGKVFGGLFSFLGFARGGLVPDHAGRRGEDSVAALLTPGEMVIDESTTSALRRLVGHVPTAPRYASGGVVAPMAQGSTTINVGLMGRMDGPSMQRWVDRDITPAVARGLARARPAGGLLA